ncbi:MAG: cupin domain-containing protein [Erysipelotrichaceae bacterium]|nr:cupin domain-containing protein [Erysipelotrichaceae bacterium]
MIIRKQERTVKEVEALKQGTGTSILTTIAEGEQLFNHVKMYTNIILKKDCGLGYHNHVDEMEVILINKGQAVYNSDGVESNAFPGDVLICEDGHYHSIKNVEDDELLLTALIIKK